MKVYRHFYIRDEFVCDRIQSENEWKIIYSRNNLGGGGVDTSKWRTIPGEERSCY